GINTYGYVGGNPINRIDPLGLASLKVDLYVGLGGGFTIGYNSKTNNWFYGGRLGIGFGAGANLDLIDRGPESLPRRTSPYADNCSTLSANESGLSIGGYGNIGASLGPFSISYGAQGGRFFDGTGNSYSLSPGLSPSFNAIGAKGGLSFGGAIGFEVINWGGN
ncbi:rhs family protein, partial [Idiomarina xiamenensis]